MGKEDENPLIAAFGEWVVKLKRQDCDAFDRLSNRYTIALLVTTSVVIATKSYMSDSIDCFVPAEFKHGNDNWIKYTDNFCWVNNTYYVPNTAALPGPGGNLEQIGGNEIKYYQWVPIIIAFMLFLFNIPVKFWEFAMWSSGYELERQIQLLSDDENVDPEKRDKTTEYIVAQLWRHITFSRSLGRVSKVNLGSGFGSYLFMMCVVTKLLYIAVPLSLLFGLSICMGPGYHDYGIRAMYGLIDDNGDYIENPMFPRKAYCNFEIRGLGKNIRTYTAECVLPVNLLNDKIFLLFWWWFLVLAQLSVIGLAVLLVKNCRRGGRAAYIEKYLHIMKVADPESEQDDADIRIFADQFLNLDGVYCLRVIAMNTMDVVAGEIIAQLYTKWKSEQRSKGD